ncbi:FAD-dependent oxidoreductase [Glutamicibacter arilaitensis]|uniref:FAD-dependent oxidoreductase n=1 Tax=Glutamicibacter arilaitensis TaxID=256701 RepID=UPI00384D9509
MRQRANLLWAEVSKACGTELLHRTGLVNHGEVTGQRRIQRSISAAGFDSQRLSIAEAEERFAGMEFETEALYIPAGGRVNADLAVSTLQRMASNSGAAIRHNQRVTTLSAISDERVSVQLEDAAGCTTLRTPCHCRRRRLDTEVNWRGYRSSADPCHRRASGSFRPIRVFCSVTRLQSLSRSRPRPRVPGLWPDLRNAHPRRVDLGLLARVGPDS